MEMSPRIPRCFRIAQTLENVLMVFYARYMSDAVLEQRPNERESYAGSYSELMYAIRFLCVAYSTGTSVMMQVKFPQLLFRTLWMVLKRGRNFYDDILRGRMNR